MARAEPGADRVRWIHGDVTALPPLQVDLAVMTANVAQVFLTDAAWGQTLRAINEALRPGGHLVFETRDPARRAWEGWTHVFDRDGEVIRSDSTLRFRPRADVEQSLHTAGYVLEEVREAPDRPGRELVFVAAAGTQR